MKSPDPTRMVRAKIQDMDIFPHCRYVAAYFCFVQSSGSCTYNGSTVKRIQWNNTTECTKSAPRPVRCGQDHNFNASINVLPMSNYQLPVIKCVVMSDRGRFCHSQSLHDSKHEDCDNLNRKQRTLFCLLVITIA